jgi:probable HAF family extracellular repeat protein
MRQRILAGLILSVPGATVQAASFTPLGSLIGPTTGFTYSHANGISADGSVVVGRSFDGTGAQAFRWTRDGGMVGLGHLASGRDSNSLAFDVSANGDVVVGESGARPFRWTNGTGIVDLGVLPTYAWGFAFAVSADGSVVVGQNSSDRSTLPPDFRDEAFRWTTQSGLVGLGDLPDAEFSSYAFDVSTDGSVIVGRGTTDPNDGIRDSAWEAFRWTSDSGMVGLGDLPGSSFQSEANAVSADGSIIVGYGISDSGWEGFRWTSTGGMVGIGSLCADCTTTPLDVSADGSVIVGMSQADLDDDDAIFWTDDAGWQLLYDVLLANGATGLSGWTLTQANAVSADGRWIAGWGYNALGQEEAFLADIAPVPLPAVGWLLAPAFGLIGWLRRPRVATN